jgi:hypothetical protein
MGWPLFPCSARTKAPLTPHGFKDATCDLRRIEEWYYQYPGCAWGCATSAERGVIDIDIRHGGDKTLAALEAKHGPMPITPRAKTGGGGWHYLCSFPPGTKCGKAAPGIDRKAEGGYFILPPSRIDIPEHNGRAYAWEVRPWDSPIAMAPAWALGEAKAVSSPTPTPKTEADAWVVGAAEDDLLTHPGSPEGERRRTLCRLVGVHLARGDSEGTIYALAEAWALRCLPAFDEWRKHVDGLLRKEEAKAKPSLFCPPSSWGQLFPSFPSVPAKERVGLSAEWPALSPEAHHGLFGEMLKAVSPETEADAAAVLLGWLCCFGNVVGRGAWSAAGADTHHPALYVGIVGRTSDAKGMGFGVSLWPFKQVEPEWASACIANGIGSGEGLVERVADAQTFMNMKGEAEVIYGATDKRCLLRLSELSQCFKRGRRENATLSEHLREAWNGEPIHVPNRKGNGLSTSGYAISMVGDITPGVLRNMMDNGTEGFDGFANRFLWVVVRSDTDLPDGGNISVLEPFLGRLAEALAFAKKAGRMRRDAEADALWREAYPSLKRSGDSVPHTDRARPYVLRLSMLYALADCSAVIRREHLRAALAVWDYCRASAKIIFGDTAKAEAEADPLWLQVLNAITESPDISRSDLLRAFRAVDADAMDGILARLEAEGLVHRRMVQAEGGGRPAERWYPVKPDGDGEGEGDDNDNPLSLSSETPFETGRKEITPAEGSEAGCAGKGRKEGNNSAPDAEGRYFLPSGVGAPVSPKEESGCHCLPAPESSSGTDAHGVKEGL